MIKVAENVKVKEPEPVKYYMSWLPEGSEFVTSYEIPGGESLVYTNENDAVVQLTYTTDMASSLFVDGVKLCIGAGGSLDVLAGTVKRAPEIFIKLNLEWFYRLCKQPSRIGRFMALPKFIITVAKNK